MESQQLKSFATQVRRDILRMVYDVQSGHPGGSLGCADFFTVVFNRFLKHNPGFNMEAKGEDVFILSNGHISPVYYSTLARTGYFPVSELATFRKLNTRLQGHPTTHEHLPGVRIASGSLGQGVSVAAGMALQKKIDGDNHTIWVLTGDGELQEGQIWEAVMFAGHHKLDNILLTVDFNRQQIDGTTIDIMGFTELANKFEAFGWDTITIEGNDIDALLQDIPKAQAMLGQGKPVAIMLKTEMGFGVDFMTGTHAWHGKAPNAEQFEKAMAQLPVSEFGDY